MHIDSAGVAVEFKVGGVSPLHSLPIRAVSVCPSSALRVRTITPVTVRPLISIVFIETTLLSTIGHGLRINTLLAQIVNQALPSDRGKSLRQLRYGMDAVKPEAAEVLAHLTPSHQRPDCAPKKLPSGHTVRSLRRACASW